jgi:uncharacterized HAD superfamily protein
LAETIQSMLKKRNYIWKWKKVAWEDLNTYNLWEIKKLWITKNWALWMFVKFQLWSWLTKKIKPVKWARGKLLELKKKWYRLYAVTARLSWLRLSTKLWLKRHFPDCFEHIVFANFFTNRARKKSEICKEIWASIIIEDNLETCIDCVNQWIKCFLLDKPRNQSNKLNENIKRVYSWSEIDL